MLKAQLVRGELSKLEFERQRRLIEQGINTVPVIRAIGLNNYQLQLDFPDQSWLTTAGGMR